MRGPLVWLAVGLVLALPVGAAATSVAGLEDAAPVSDPGGRDFGGELPPLLADSLGPVHYVATTGDDLRTREEARNPETPWRTIQRALDALEPGDQALVRGGEYAQSLVMNRAGTAKAPITVRAYPGERVVVRPDGSGSMDYPLRVTAGAAYFRFAGFVVEGSPLHTTMNIWVSDGQQQRGPAPTHDIEISACEIANGVGTGILVSPNTERVHVLGNRVHDNGDGSRQHQGIYFQGGHGLIANNLVYGHANGFGIQVRGNYPDPDTEVKIPARDVIVTSNTVVGNGLSGIMVENNATRITVVNNIAAFNGSRGILGYDNGSGSVLPGNFAFNNLGFGNRSGQFGNPHNLVVVDFSGGNVVADPRFVDAAATDFHLDLWSPAIDAATDRYSPPADHDLLRRPVGAAADLGAYER